MFTWIFNIKRALAGVTLLALVSGCSETLPTGFAVTRKAPEKMSVAGNTVVIGGPKGYCVDRGVSRDSAENAFVLLASCAAISGDEAAERPRVPTVLAVSVFEQSEGGLAVKDQADRLAGFFESSEGRAVLARDGRAESVQVVDTFLRNGAFVIHARDNSEDAGTGLGQEHWRAIFDVNGHIVSASVLALRDRPISGNTGATILEYLVTRIRAESTANGA